MSGTQSQNEAVDPRRDAPRDLSVTSAAPPVVGWWPMLFISLGLAMFIMDSTIVNVSLPKIIDELTISSIDAEWVQAVYALIFAALLIIFGRLGDRVGRRKVFVAGAIVFGVASVVAATSQSGSALIVGRALQGLGGAMMSPASLSLINATYRGRRRPIAFAIYGSVIGGMAAMGPLLGGFLTEHYSWRWAFGINIPVTVAIIVGSLMIVPESRDTRVGPGRDVLGAVLSAFGIGAFVFALIEGRGYGWWTAVHDVKLLGRTWPLGGPSPVPLALFAAVACLTSLYVVEARRARAGKIVLIDVSLFRIGSFGFGSLAAMILSLGEMGILFSIPLFLQSALGYSAFRAGGLLAVLAVGAFFAGPTTAKLARRFSPRFVAQLGMALEVIGILGIAMVISTDVGFWQMGVWLAIYGAGVGYASAQLTGLILADVPIEQSGQASGTQSTARQVGAALGTAVLGTILFVGLAHDTEHRVAQVSGVSAVQAAAIAAGVEQSAGTAIPGLAGLPNGEEVVAAASEGFAAALQRTAFFAAGFVGLGLVATVLLPKEAGRREDEEDETLPPIEALETA